MRRLLNNMATDEGAALVLIAVSMMLIIGMAALAIDLGALRGDLRADGLAADAAVTAGVAEVDPFSGSDAQQACEVAWDYLLLNLDDEGASVSPPNCALLGGVCSPGVAREAAATAGPYAFVIINPVPDAHTLMGTQAINGQIDGVSCQRLGVSIQRTRNHWFGRVIGSASGSTNVSAVARHAAGSGGGEVVPLLVLEPISCDALFTSGQGKVTVSFFNDTPGFIVIDSDGSKTGNPNGCIGAQNWTIDSKGNQNGWIRAIPTLSGIPSVILSYALSGAFGANPTRAYDPGDLTSPVDPADITDLNEPPTTWFRLFPRPSFVSQRITRSAIDHRYNCKLVYPDYPLDVGNPGLGGIPISPCLDAPAPYIDQLVTAYGDPAGISPMGISQRWTDLYPCTVDDTTWMPATISVSGDWWVDCPGGLIISNSKMVDFNAGNVVFDGDVDLRSFGVLRVNPSASSDHVVFVRDGGRLLKGAQTSITLEQTFVFIQNGRIDIGAGAGGLVWTAPLAGNFEDLALWSEASLQHQIGGQAGNTLTGTFFTPFSDPFVLTGQAGQFQTDAQFVTRRLEVKGQGEVKMHPDPDRTTLIPIREVRLIR
ncbi:MAG: hypothetical protein V3S26_04560 [Acidimicrobiia bacterium]